MKNFRNTALILGGLLLALGAFIFVVSFVLPLFFGAVIEIQWVASGVIFAGFLIGLFKIRQRGWSQEGSLLLILIVLVGTIFDIPGNPIFNAPYEALFLEPGQRLQGSAMVETIGGETHVSGSATVVDAEGRYVSSPNGFLMAFYRALIYFVFYAVLLTLSGLLPNRRQKATAEANA
ncbi:hypothetical protein [Micrococcoides hystricis]|uniref:Uncharacterized protein n=1 Tax=Micrococcoides hystricis TaxID=1572761 RepID=A0ABV6PCH2_9MICC